MSDFYTDAAGGYACGRKKKWESPDDLAREIEEYFEKCDGHTISVTKKGIKTETQRPKPYTVEGLAVFLDCSRVTLFNYENKGGDFVPYWNVIKRAKDKILANKMEGALSGDYSTPFTIFDLKNNHGFTNVEKTDITTDGKAIGLTPIIIERERD